MAMRIAPGEKFACFAFTFYSVDEQVPDEVQLGPRLWAVRGLDLAVAEHWDTWMGSIKMDALRDANSAIYTTSSQPEILDPENAELVETLGYLLYGILLQGVPGYDQGFSLHGANVGGKINVRQFSDLKGYQPSFDTEPAFRLGVPELQRAAGLVERLRAVNTGGPANWARLRRGLKVLFDGTLLPNKDGDRLHQLVRAVEALVKPEIAKTKSQFAHRISQTFTLANDETRETLLQLFDLRSCVEHMHAVLDALPGDEAERIATVNRRTRQIDVLARAALLRVMMSDVLMEAFRSDATIDAFWQMSDAARVAMWGQPIDLTKTA